MIPVVLYGRETWTLDTDLKMQIDVFGTNIVCQRQLRLYGHVARYPEADTACRVVSERDNPWWRRPRGRPQSSWLEQVDASCWESLDTARGPARGDRRRRVGEAYAPMIN